MLYDLAQAPPEQGSLLESVFLVLAKRRQEQEFLRTRVLIEATLAPHLEKSTVSEAFGDYFDSMFPYLGSEKTVKTEDLQREALEHWVGKGPLTVKPIGMPADQKRSQVRSALQRSAARVAAAEDARRAGTLRRLK